MSTPDRTFRKLDSHILFALAFDDGRTAYMRVPPKTVEFGSRAVLGIARARQSTGEVPAGAIASVKRVR